MGCWLPFPYLMDGEEEEGDREECGCVVPHAALLVPHAQMRPESLLTRLRKSSTLKGWARLRDHLHLTKSLLASLKSRLILDVVCLKLSSPTSLGAVLSYFSKGKGCPALRRRRATESQDRFLIVVILRWSITDCLGGSGAAVAELSRGTSVTSAADGRGCCCTRREGAEGAVSPSCCLLLDERQHPSREEEVPCALGHNSPRPAPRTTVRVTSRPYEATTATHATTARRGGQGEAASAHT